MCNIYEGLADHVKDTYWSFDAREQCNIILGLEGIVYIFLKYITLLYEGDESTQLCQESADS